MSLTFSTSNKPGIPLIPVKKSYLDAWLARLNDAQRAWAESAGFKAAACEVLTLPNQDGSVAMAAVGLGDEKSAHRNRFVISAARAKLPNGIYDLATDQLDVDELEEASLGWLLAGYRFDRYATAPTPMAQLKPPTGIDVKRLESIAAGEALTRDLINTPASDMGPAELETAAQGLAAEFGAGVRVVTGDDLLGENLPMIHAVGRASDRAPRLIDLTWGTSGPSLTLVGKGVCFDTGGLNIKPGASMGLMKKDMGGSAAVLGLARMIMSLNMPIRLRVLIPAVENAINGSAFRPSDILTSRKGLTVEINNTDAEGRLVLADALALADEEKPDLILSMATLTGAARIAVGPDMVPFYATEQGDAAAVMSAAQRVRDPVWQMPFWDAYETMIEPGIADLDNAPKGAFAGSITAALFLRRFVTDTPRYMHFDMYGWQPTSAPARPKGGVGQGARALLEALPELLGL
ncbi:MAG: leucyl aminopeptidase family protein [Marinosulfonomonas sp.]|nr:leucyl aminopeptidase family protein [Marinosulfonomonas sp.]